MHFTNTKKQKQKNKVELGAITAHLQGASRPYGMYSFF